MKKANVTRTITTEEINLIINDTAANTSQKIRMMFDEGLEYQEIADGLGIRYNQVYNVLQNYILRNDFVVEKQERSGSVANDQVLSLLREGKPLAEVSRITKMNYNQVWKLAKENGLTKKQNAPVATPVAVVPVIPAAPEVVGVKKAAKK